MNLRVAIAEQFFVDDCQQRVLYGRPGFPYLVEEHHVSRRQIALRVALVFVRVLQFADAHGAEYLVGRAEARHQILERPRILERQFQPTCHHRLGHTRRAEQYHALPGQCRHQRERKLRFLLVDALVDSPQQAQNPIFHCFLIIISVLFDKSLGL